MNRKDREIVARELVKVAKDLTAAKGPFFKSLSKHWDKLYDLERSLESVSREYDTAASYRGKEGQKDSEMMMSYIQEAKKELNKLINLISKIETMEMKYTRKHGTPQEYTERMRNEMFPS